MIAGLFAAYLIGYVLLYPRLGNSITTFIFVPILGAAYLMGLIGGISTWTLGVVTQIIVMRIMFADGWQAVFEASSIFGLLAILPVALVVGRIRDTSKHLHIELTERKKAEARLKESQRFAGRIADTIPDLIYLYDLRDNRVLYLNGRAESVFARLKLHKEQSLQTLLSAVLHPDDLQLFKDIPGVFADMRDGEFIETDFRMRDEQDDYRWYHIRSSVFERDAQGKPRQVLGLARDVTELKRATELAHEREKTQIALEKERELTRLKNRFMMTISHEFRTPLAIILSSSELLERYYDRLSEERRNECLRAINLQIRHIRDMLGEIALLLETEAKKPSFMPSVGDLAAFCERVKTGAEAASNHTHPISFTAAGDLSAVSFDESILDTVLKQLFTNAIKYSPPGTLIRLDARGEADGVTLAVQDMGVGIPADDMARIFDTFYRGNNVGHIPGIGLGLKIVRDYVALHQGQVDVSSQEGLGTTFSVRLPLRYT